jgi:hypothetical protein
MFHVGFEMNGSNKSAFDRWAGALNRERLISSIERGGFGSITQTMVICIIVQRSYDLGRGRSAKVAMTGETELLQTIVIGTFIVLNTVWAASSLCVSRSVALSKSAPVKFALALLCIRVRRNVRRSAARKTQFISGEATRARRRLFTAQRSKQDANHFRRSQASETQIISGDAKQARRKSFSVTQNKRDANYFWRSEDSETQIIFGEAQHASRNSFRRSEASETQVISCKATQARRKSFPVKRSKRDAHHFRRREASETQTQVRRKLFLANRK